MRYIAFIFSIYLTLLSLFPCQDREDMNASAIQVILQKSHSPWGERGQETCPPFCICSCCSTARQLTETVTISVFTQSIINEYPDHGIPAVQEQPIKIWQPPQIS